MTDLQRPHADLRAAVILAGKEICKLQMGREDGPVLHLRQTLRKARTFAVLRVSPSRPDQLAFLPHPLLRSIIAAWPEGRGFTSNN